jgi:thermitase
MRKLIVALAAVVLLISSFPAIVSAGPPGNTGPVSTPSSEQILVKFKPDVTLPEAAEIHRQLGGQVKETIPDIGVQVVTVPKGQEIAKVKAYSANARVAYAEPDFVAQALGSPDDPWFGNQWGMVRIRAPQAWDVTTGSPAISIAILDTGVDQDHPDLADKVISNVNFSNSATADDIDGHGTHVAGIAAAITNNGIGVAGLGYGSTIMNVKVLGDTGSGSYSWLASGIVWAADNGADVINMSLGGSSASATLEAAINHAWAKGVVVVAAAGNNGNSAPFYPAYYTNCIAVAGTDSLDRLAGWSNYGNWIDVAAPGVSIVSTLVNNRYGVKSGTSMASPHVAGLAALVFTVATDTNGNGRLNDEVRATIQDNCDDIGVSGIGSGLINAYKAVDGGTAAPPTPTPPSPPPPPPPPATGDIAGTVRDGADNSVIAGATVSCSGASAVTDSSGHFTIANLPQGVYAATASAPGYTAALQTVDVVAGEVSQVNFALTKPTPPSPQPFWVQSITFGVRGRNLSLSVKVINASGPVTGAQVGMRLTNGVTSWSLSGTTDSAGLVSFTVSKALAGDYVASVTGVTAAGCTWDATRGVTSATYSLVSGGHKK